MSKSFGWKKVDVGRLFDWMEDNQEALRGSRSSWVKDCKEQVFADDFGITTQRIGVKYNNSSVGYAIRDVSGQSLTVPNCP